MCYKKGGILLSRLSLWMELGRVFAQFALAIKKMGKVFRRRRLTADLSGGSWLSLLCKFRRGLGVPFRLLDEGILHFRQIVAAILLLAPVGVAWRCLFFDVPRVAKLLRDIAGQ